MSAQRAKRRARELREILIRAADRYYNDGESDIEDSEYDALFDELRTLEAEHPDLVTPESPTQRVGAALPKGSSFAKVEHLAPMLSIESLTSADEVTEFAARTRRFLELDDDAPLPWAVEPKFDGVSANLLYVDGELVRGLSRGDGALGEDITQNLRTIRDVPLRLAGGGPFPARIEIRGEVIMTRTNFDRLREEAETTTSAPFRNARNTAAGTLKLLDPSTVARRRLDFVCWGVGLVDGLDVASYTELRERLDAFGLRLSDDYAVVDDVDGIRAFHADLESRRDAIEYEMDGVIAKVDTTELQRRLGRTARTPRWLLAYKFAPRQATTRVEAIAAQVGRTGAITPVAHLEPVELAGVTVRRATLHNWNLLAERDVREGDVVDIERAGDVIPAVVKVHTDRRGDDSRPTEPPSACPSCGSPPEPSGAFLYCVNASCPAQLKGRIVHLASRRALDIVRLGPKYVDQLMEAGLVTTLADVFALPDRRDEILELERWGEKSFEKLVAELDRAKRPALARFLHALGIRQVGEQTARDLADAFGSLDAIVEASDEQLVEVDGVGPEVAASIRRFFDLESNRAMLAAVHAAGVEVEAVDVGAPAEDSTDAGLLAGRVFCFTGSLSRLTRDEARAIAEDLGAKTSNSVTKKVSDVVAGAKAGSKLDKAKKLELTIHTEDEFLALVGRA